MACKESDGAWLFHLCAQMLGGEAMNISEIISIIHDVLSMVYMIASSAYKLSKDIHGSERKPAPEGKRNNRRKRR